MTFDFIDEIVELVPGERVVAVRDVKPDEPYFEHHFPGFPVMPGVLLTETMGQAAAKALDAEQLPRGKAMLARIRGATFREWVRPGDRLTLTATIKSNQPVMATAECRALVGEKTVAEADLLFTFVPMDTLAPDYRDRALQEYLSRHGSAPEG